MHYTTRLVVQADDVIGMHYYCFNCQFRPPVGKLLLKELMKHALGRKTTICPEVAKTKVCHILVWKSLKHCRC